MENMIVVKIVISDESLNVKIQDTSKKELAVYGSKRIDKTISDMEAVMVTKKALEKKEIKEFDLEFSSDDENFTRDRVKEKFEELCFTVK